MLFSSHLHDGIRSGQVTVAFRRWTCPTVSEGGTLRSPVGVLHIDELAAIEPDAITDDEARVVGHDSAAAVLASLRPGPDRQLYRVRFHLLGDDPRIASGPQRPPPRRPCSHRCPARPLGPAPAPTGRGRAALDVIVEHEGERSLDLAARLDCDQRRLKRRIRQLKELGLTESLDTGYRLAPRGVAYRGRSAWAVTVEVGSDERLGEPDEPGGCS